MLRNGTEDRMAKNFTHNAFAEQTKRGFHLSLELYRIRSDTSNRFVHSNAAVHRSQDRSSTDLGAREEHAEHDTIEDQRRY